MKRMCFCTFFFCGVKFIELCSFSSMIFIKYLKNNVKVLFLRFIIFDAIKI